MNNATLHPSQTSPSKLTEWTNEPSIADLKSDYESAKSESDNQVSQIEHWLDNLHIKGSAVIKTPENKSSIQPKTIRKNAEWRYSSLSEPFLSTPDLFNVYPTGANDRDAAYQNQLVLNRQFNHQLDKVSLIDEYVRAAVDQGSAILRVGWEYEEIEVDVEKPIFELQPNQDPAYLQELEQLVTLAQNDPQTFSTQVPVEVQSAVQSSLTENIPYQAVQVGSEIVKEVKVIKNQPTVEVCNYSNIVPDPTCEGDMTKAKFVVHEFTTSLDDLRKDGRYSNLDSINISTNSAVTDAEYVAKDNGAFNFSDEPRKKITAYEYWGYWDIDGTGTTKPFVATWVENTLIRLEESPFPFNSVPFVSVPFMPVAKSLYGEPDGELIEDNQKVVGAVTRSMIDIMASIANGQRGTRKGVLDTTNKRRHAKGLDYEFNSNDHPQNAFYTATSPEIPNSAQFMLQQQNFEAESFTGVKAFSQGINGNALGESVGNGRGALDAASKRELGILRRLASGMTKVGRMVVAMNAEFLSDEEIIRVTDDDVVHIKREDLAGEYDLQLTISTVEEDNAKAQELAFMLQTTGNTLPQELTLLILADIARLRKMPVLAQKIDSFKPEPDPLAQRSAELDIAMKEAEIAELQAKTAEYIAQAELHKAKAAQTISARDKTDLDYIEQESGVTQERDLQKLGEQAKGNAKLEFVKNKLAAQKPTETA